MSWDLKLNITSIGQSFGINFSNPISMLVDWDDGGGPQIVIDGNNTYSYTSTGIKIVQITGGTVDHIYISSGKSLLIEVTNVIPNFSITNFMSTFKDCINLVYIPIGLFDNNPNATSFSETFRHCENLSAIPIGLFNNNPNATDFYSTFAYCYDITTIPTGLFDNNPNIVTFGGVFYNCFSLTAIPIELFDNNLNVTTFGNSFRGNHNLTGYAPKLWTRIPSIFGDSCFKDCNNLTNYAQIPLSWGGLGLRGYIDVEPALNTIMPSVTSGPYTVNLTVGDELCNNEYELILCSYGSNSYSHYSVIDQDNLYLIPRWRFLDTSGNIISSLTFNNWTSSYDGLSSSVIFYYVDDMPTWSQSLCINVEVKNICSEIECCNVTGTSMSAIWTNVIPVSVGEWIPQYIKYTSDGITDIGHKWTEHPIKWYATLHEELSGPIIFSQSFNLTSNLISVSSEFCPSIIDVIAFDKLGNYGWIDGNCITNLSTISAFITGNAYITSNNTSITGTSNEFIIKQFIQPFEIRRFNESWDATKSIKSYAMAPHLNSKYNLWDNFIGHSVGQLSAGQQLGRKSYERISNFPSNHIDIDESNIKQLYSLSQYLDVPIDDYDLNYPPELQRLIDIGSISHSKLWGEIVKCNLNITDNQICPRCGYKHSNLSDMIEDPFNYTLTAGIPFIQHDRFNTSSEGWTIEYPPVLVVNGTGEWELKTISSSFGTAMAMNNTGSYQLSVSAGVTFGSTDFGETWSIKPTYPTGITHISISNDANYQVATVGGHTYVSNDGGQTWVDRYGDTDWPPYNFVTWRRVAMSSNGQYITLVGTKGIWVSNDYGLTWYQTYTGNTWSSVDMNSSGSYQLAGRSGLSNTYILESFDYGETWNSTGLSVRQCRSIAVSDDANVRVVIASIATSSPTYIYINRNNTGYIQTNPTGYLQPIDSHWEGLGISGDGHHIEATLQPSMYTVTLYRSAYSDDYGITWTYRTDGPQAGLWAELCFSTNGTYKITTDGNGLWRGTTVLDVAPIYVSNKNLCELSATDENNYITTYPFTQLTAFSAYDMDFCSHYDFYEYKDGFPLLETCDPLDPRHIQSTGVINRNDEYNTLDVESLSSVEDWFGDDGKLQEIIEYELLRGLQLSTQTCSISS